MKKILFLLLILFSHAGFAELYKCSTAVSTIYQGKPCQTSHVQKVIAQAAPAPKPNPLPVLSNVSSSVIERDAHGKIKRSEKAKDDFKKANPCPANGKNAGSCPGYVIDHITALACGGADNPENMQWQTLAEGKEKDSWERDGCKTAVKKSNYRQSPAADNQDKSKTVYTGKHGGRYVLTKSGKKRYLGREI